MTYVGGELRIESVTSMATNGNLEGLHSLSYVGAYVSIFNSDMENVEGLRSLAYIGGYLLFGPNAAVTTLEGFR